MSAWSTPCTGWEQTKSPSRSKGLVIKSMLLNSLQTSRSQLSLTHAKPQQRPGLGDSTTNDIPVRTSAFRWPKTCHDVIYWYRFSQSNRAVPINSPSFYGYEDKDTVERGIRLAQLKTHKTIAVNLAGFPIGKCDEVNSSACHSEVRIPSENGKHELFVLLKWRSFDLAAASGEGKGRNGMGMEQGPGWGMLHREDLIHPQPVGKCQSSTVAADMKKWFSLQKKEKKKRQRKRSGSPARSCGAVVRCWETFMIKESLPASFFCHRKVKPFYKTNNMQTLKLWYKEKSKDYAFD